MNYPLKNDIESVRLREYLIAEDYAMKQYGDLCKVFLGNDECGVPDAFIFIDNKLIACVELVGYTLGKINEIQSHTEIGKFFFHIDIEKCSEVHSRQEHPFTLINKKILGGRKYQKFDALELVLLIHTEVYVKSNSLCFAMGGIMGLNPSVNNFMHHKDEIIGELKGIIKKNQPTQWDRICLIDYTYSPNIRQCPLLKLQ